VPATRRYEEFIDPRKAIPTSAGAPDPSVRPYRMSDSLPSFEEFLATQSVQISLWNFTLNLLLAAVLGTVLAWFYTRFGHSLSNRRLFARHFVLLAMTTMLIISVVKASLALSLGLVGALSIVRFRSAIKEPEELAYLFLVIAIGLGLGADQRWITIVAFGAILGILWVSRRTDAGAEPANLILTVRSDDGAVSLARIVEILERHCAAIELKRVDEGKDQLDAAFIVHFRTFADLEAGKADLRRLDDSLRIALLEPRHLGGAG
jgi:hypothetical protein